MGPERSGRWPGNWGCTGERCGRRWPVRCRRDASGSDEGSRYYLPRRTWAAVADEVCSISLLDLTAQIELDQKVGRGPIRDRRPDLYREILQGAEQ
jgi:hypothetical protein